MPKLPQVKPKVLIVLLEREGFISRKTKSSHVVFTHPDGRTTTVPVHNKPLAKGTLRGILRQTGLSIEDLLKKK